MNFLTDIKNELIQEAAVTRKFLAIHVAEIIAWWKNVIEEDELNFINFEPADIKTTDGLLIYFDDLLNDALLSLKNANVELMIGM